MYPSNLFLRVLSQSGKRKEVKVRCQVDSKPRTVNDDGDTNVSAVETPYHVANHRWIVLQ